MDVENTTFSFVSNFLTTIIIYFILICGNHVSEYLNITQNPTYVIGVLICVVCCRYIFGLLGVFLFTGHVTEMSSSKYKNIRRSSDNREIASVIIAYNATGPEQLSLQIGQMINIRQKTRDWWEGEIPTRGQKPKVGWFPANYVKLLSSAVTQDTKSTSSKNVISSIIGSTFLIVCGVGAFHLTSVVYGAPLLISVPETFYFSCLLTCTTILPCCCVLGTDMDSWFRVLCMNSPENNREVTLRTGTIGSVLGAWFGAFPIPLDWDRPWQAWPISCVIGSALGYGAGLLISHVQIYIQQRKINKLKLR